MESVKRNRSITPEPFEEPSTLSNVVDYFSSYVKPPTEQKVTEDKILWMKFVRLSKSIGVGILVGRAEGVQMFLMMRDWKFILVFSKCDLVAQTATVSSSDVEEVSTLLVLAFNGRLEVICMHTGQQQGTIAAAVRGGVYEVGGEGRVVFAWGSAGEMALICPRKVEVLVRLEAAAGIPASCCIEDSWVAWADGRWRPQHASKVIGSSSNNSENGAATHSVDTGGTILSVARLTSSPISLVWLAHFHAVIPASTAGNSDTQLTVSCITLSQHSAPLPLLIAGVVTGVPAGAVVYRLEPHVSGAKYASIRPLYRLHRGDSPCSIRDMTVSSDCRLVAGVSARHTVHLWSASVHGGPLSARLMASTSLVNRMSRLQRSCGLQEHQLGAPVGGLLVPSIVQLKPLPPGMQVPSPIPCFFQCDETDIVSDSRSSIMRSERLLLAVPSLAALLHYNIHIQADSMTLDDAPYFLSASPVRKWTIPSPRADHFLPNDWQISDNSNTTTANMNANLFNVNNINSTPRFWSSHIEISAQIVPTASSIHKLDKFSISTYQSNQSDPINIELVVPTTSSAFSPPHTTSQQHYYHHHSQTAPVKVPSSSKLQRETQRIEMCNSLCGSSFGDHYSQPGSVDYVGLDLQQAILTDHHHQQQQQQRSQFWSSLTGASALTTGLQNYHHDFGSANDCGSIDCPDETTLRKRISNSSSSSLISWKE